MFPNARSGRGAGRVAEQPGRALVRPANAYGASALGCRGGLSSGRVVAPLYPMGPSPSSRYGLNVRWAYACRPVEANAEQDQLLANQDRQIPTLVVGHLATNVDDAGLGGEQAIVASP